MIDLFPNHVMSQIKGSQLKTRNMTYIHNLSIWYLVFHLLFFYKHDENIYCLSLQSKTFIVDHMSN